MTTDRLDALRLAAKRLRRLALECPPGSSIRDDACEWAAEADDALRAVSGSVGGPEPRAFREIRDWMEHCVSAAEEGVDYACPREVLDALTTLRLMEKCGRGKWRPTKEGELLAAAPMPVSGSVGGEAVAWQYRDLRPGMSHEWRPTTEAIYESHLNGSTTGRKDIDWQVRALYAAPTAAPQVDGSKLREAVAIVLEGWTLPDGARKTLEAAYWSSPTPAQSEPPAEGGV